MIEFGYDIILWDVDPLDWKRPGPAVVRSRILKETRPGSIVLSHDIHPGTIEAMSSTLDELQAKGFKFVTVSELIDMATPVTPHPKAEPAEKTPAKAVPVISPIRLHHRHLLQAARVSALERELSISPKLRSLRRTHLNHGRCHVERSETSLIYSRFGSGQSDDSSPAAARRIRMTAPKSDATSSRRRYRPQPRVARFADAQ